VRRRRRVKARGAMIDRDAGKVGQDRRRAPPGACERGEILGDGLGISRQMWAVRRSREGCERSPGRRVGPFGGSDKVSVDVALATNMIAVGLDITRLGLMLVSGQPKTAAEYIQATSRVGRDENKPGLVVVLLNVNKPRDRSHYERFLGFHSTFYRNVEVTSVTPFSPRALDRGLAAVVVAIARLGLPDFAPNKGAALAQQRRTQMDLVGDVFANRAASYKMQSAHEQAANASETRKHVARILDNWAFIAKDVAESGVDSNFGYQRDKSVAKHLLYDILDSADLEVHWEPFRTPRSLRDVEPSVLVKLKTPDGRRITED